MESRETETKRIILTTKTKTGKILSQDVSWDSCPCSNGTPLLQLTTSV